MDLPGRPSPTNEWVASRFMADTAETQETAVDTRTDADVPSTDPPDAPGGNPDNRETVDSMDAPELRNAVIELLTIIDTADEMDVIVTVSDDGTIIVEAA